MHLGVSLSEFDYLSVAASSFYSACRCALVSLYLGSFALACGVCPFRVHALMALTRKLEVLVTYSYTI